MNTVEQIFSVALLLLAVALIVAGAGLIVYQGYQWLRYGLWPPYSILDILSYFGWAEPWSSYPRDWKGVHKALGFIPASITIIVSSLPVFGLSAEMSGK